MSIRNWPILAVKTAVAASLLAAAAARMRRSASATGSWS
jgi:hypothetical protein